MPTPVSPSSYDGLRDLQRFCGENAAEKGFDEETHEIRNLALELRIKGNDKLADSIIRNQISATLNLVHDEISEAHEELRSGKLVNEEYVNGGPGKETKPEGIPSEIADAVIRLLHLAHREEIDLANVIANKLAYNATREKMHGRKF